ncbi:MAG: hypothetical protein R3A47_11445 [Polyangiales bacterium]
MESPAIWRGLVTIVRGSAPNDSEVFLGRRVGAFTHHFGGRPSFINSRLLDRSTFTRAIFLWYGRRTGGIVEVTTREIRRLIAPWSRGAFADRCVGACGRGPVSWKIDVGGFRRSLIDLAFKAFAPDDIGVTAAPGWLRLSIVRDVELITERDRIHFMFYGSNDISGGLFRRCLCRRSCGTERQNYFLFQLFSSASWRHKFKISSEDVDLMFDRSSPDVGLGELFRINGKFNQIYGRGEWRFQVNPKLRLIAGTDVFMIPGNLEFLGPPPGQTEGRGSQEPISGQDTLYVNDNYFIVRPGFYFESNLDVGALRLITAARLDYFGAINEWVVDPRVSALVNVSDRVPTKNRCRLV